MSVNLMYSICPPVFLFFSSYCRDRIDGREEAFSITRSVVAYSYIVPGALHHTIRSLLTNMWPSGVQFLNIIFYLKITISSVTFHAPRVIE